MRLILYTPLLPRFLGFSWCYLRDQPHRTPIFFKRTNLPAEYAFFLSENSVAAKKNTSEARHSILEWEESWRWEIRPAPPHVVGPLPELLATRLFA